MGSSVDNGEDADVILFNYGWAIMFDIAGALWLSLPESIGRPQCGLGFLLGSLLLARVGRRRNSTCIPGLADI